MRDDVMPPSGLFWLLMDAEAVPDGWDDRVREVALVALLPDEARRLVDGDVPWRRLDDHERTLASALVRGRTADAIARDLGITRRTVQRRIARLRDHVGAASTEELLMQLSRWGFS